MTLCGGPADAEMLLCVLQEAAKAYDRYIIYSADEDMEKAIIEFKAYKAGMDCCKALLLDYRLGTIERHPDERCHKALAELAKSAYFLEQAVRANKVTIESLVELNDAVTGL